MVRAQKMFQLARTSVGFRRICVHLYGREAIVGRSGSRFAHREVKTPREKMKKRTIGEPKESSVVLMQGIYDES